MFEDLEQTLKDRQDAQRRTSPNKAVAYILGILFLGVAIFAVVTIHRTRTEVEAIEASRVDWNKLLDAASAGDLEFVQKEFARAPQLRTQQNEMKQGPSLLHVASHNGRDEVVKFLLANGASVAVLDMLGQTPLYAAVAGNQPSTVYLLMQNGASPMAGRDGHNPVCDAAANGSLEVLRVPLQAKVAEACGTIGEGSLLGTAAINGHLDAVNLLLAAGARRIGPVELDVIADKGHKNIAEMLKRRLHEKSLRDLAH
jgi:ankyrin repeat protein